MGTASSHPRNLGPMQAAPRCGARTRAGTPCRSPVIAGATRCRMHGGKGSGAPKGNRNALKHGRFTATMLAQGAEVRDLVRRAEMLLRSLPVESAGEGGEAVDGS